MILKTQRNELFKILIDYGLNPMDFQEENAVDSYRLRSVGEPFKFAAENYIGDRFLVTPLPDLSVQRHNGVGSIVPIYWGGVLSYFRKWAEILQREEAAPDLFANFRRSATLFISQTDTPDENFTETELRVLSGQIREIERGIAQLALPAAAQQVLLGTVHAAPEKATRFTKKEWQAWFIGAIVSQATNLALSQEHVTALYSLLKTTFTAILQLH